ncbi:SDR family NAD(P)-dependent oxidoreductase [bacterium]|nr:SDR family NAD(P)-dependent oxidoreductase [bacterium]MBU1883797.1 SDR family NAD(P)-dependent oxidoreductase [bacterium]
MKNILITGGAGFIGTHLAKRLIQDGYKVTVLDNLSPQIHGEHSELFDSIKNSVNFILGDVRNKDDWKKALLNQGIVVHLAAETGTGQSMYEIEKYVDVNIKGTAIFLDILANEKHTIQKVIIASSRAIYGEGKYHCVTHGAVYPEARKEEFLRKLDFDIKCPFCGVTVELKHTDEDSKIHPTSIYGITKQNQEQMVMLTCKALNIPAVSFRYQNVYGPGQSLSNPYTGILSIFSTRIKNNNSISVFEDGKESRDFVYIDDVIDATVLGIEKSEANFEVFNVGSGIGTTVAEVASALAINYNSDVNIDITGNYRIGDIRHNIADLSKIKKYLDFNPKYSFFDGIKKFTLWVEGQSIQRDKYQESIDELKAKGLFK